MLAAATVDAPRDPAAAELDLTLLNYLSDGTEASFADHVERFLATLAETEAQLSSTLAAGEFSALEVHAHRVLGQARMVAATTLADAALTLERAAKAHDAAGCRESLRRVRDEMRTVTAAMHRRRPSMSTA
jgi:HPt (histidine-containing phosphotransfer) domain-containing protein